MSDASRRSDQEHSVPSPPQVERDSGEEEYESEQEIEREIAPSGVTRVKTDNI
jgi:hypothetical protein